MIDLFSLIRLAPNESIERVYRSHPLRWWLVLVVAALLLAFPFFFLFDFSGGLWALAVGVWLLGLFLLWLALDVWSSSMVIVTTHRLIGATRERWGRVRIHEWIPTADTRVPVWSAGTWVAWLGTWEWTREGQTPFVLRWARRPAVQRADRPEAVSFWYRCRLAKRVLRLSTDDLKRVENVIDGEPRA